MTRPHSNFFEEQTTPQHFRPTQRKMLRDTS